MFNFYNPKFEYQPDLDDYDSAWFGHRNFGYDLVRNFKPKVIVELGTYYGTSFYSFSQAVKDTKLSTMLYAIDTWKGDVHMGDFSEDIYNKVVYITRKYFSDLKIRLIRKFFNEAVSMFEDNSIDLLHIDGTHTYEEVLNDYEKWSKKVSDNGIIMMHDIIVGDFGVWRVWEKIKKDNKDKGWLFLEFKHSFGLGVIIKNKKIQEMFSSFDFNLMKEVYQNIYKLNLANRSIGELEEEKILLEKKLVKITDKFDKMTNKFQVAQSKIDAIENSRLISRYLQLKKLVKGKES